jgi:hypothetical protein
MSTMVFGKHALRTRPGSVGPVLEFCPTFWMDAPAVNQNQEVPRLMTDLITDIWTGLKDAGMPDVMLYLSDGTACRCHWDETAVVGMVRVALLADQERKIVRIVPLHDCKGIGIASPKGTDPAGYRAVVQSKLTERSPSKTETGPHQAVV